jgi:hypothetical protein
MILYQILINKMRTHQKIQFKENKIKMKKHLVTLTNKQMMDKLINKILMKKITKKQLMKMVMKVIK